LNDEQRWLKQAGLKYLRELGIDKGQIIVDFGCNTGHYTIPAARVVGSEGTVYAIDQEQAAIDQVMKVAKNERLDNIIPLFSNKPMIALPLASVDVVFIYDVLHYLNIKERKSLYKSVNTILKDNGILSVFPKHNRDDCPRWHLENLCRREIVDEIEDSCFVLTQKVEKKLIHDDLIETGIIINFSKFKTIPV